jgi:sterol desaturase/sphingolipid hydroxylase (fatty acid hydroxylase superfamily)
MNKTVQWYALWGAAHAGAELAWRCGLRHLLVRHAPPVVGKAVWAAVLVAVTGAAPWCWAPIAAAAFLGDAAWTKLHDMHAEQRPWALTVAAPWLVAVAVYWLHGAAMLAAELLVPQGNAKLCGARRIQPRREHRFVGTASRAQRTAFRARDHPTTMWTWAQIQRVATNILQGQVAVMLPSLLAAHAAGRFRAPREPVNAWDAVHDALACVTANQVLFYHTHRLLHWPQLFRAIHRVHHEFPSPTGIVAGYCHPLELLLGNILPIFGAAVALRAHVQFMLVWIAAAVVATQVHHSGRAWPWMAALGDVQPAYHDAHHARLRGNYGADPIFDRVHGTELEGWRATDARRGATGGLRAFGNDANRADRPIPHVLLC